jgi:AcrR family transcriptional regulator
MSGVDESTLEYLRELRAKLAAKKRPRNKEGKEVSAKIVRAVIDRGTDAEARALRYLLSGNDDVDAVAEDVLRAIADHLHNLPRASNAPSRFAITKADARIMDQLRPDDGRQRIGNLVRAAKGKGELRADITDEGHIDRIERNRDFYGLLKRAGDID